MSTSTSNPLRWHLLASMSAADVTRFLDVKQLTFSAASLSKQLRNADSWGLGSAIPIIAPHAYLGSDGHAYLRWYDSDLSTFRTKYQQPVRQFDHPAGGRMTPIPPSITEATTFINDAAFVIGRSTSSKAASSVVALPCSAGERDLFSGAMQALYKALGGSNQHDWAPEAVSAPAPGVVVRRAQAPTMHVMKKTAQKSAAACVPLPPPCEAVVSPCFAAAERRAQVQQRCATSGSVSACDRIDSERIRDSARDMWRAFYRDTHRIMSESGLDDETLADGDAADLVAAAFNAAEEDVYDEALQAGLLGAAPDLNTVQEGPNGPRKRRPY